MGPADIIKSSLSMADVAEMYGFSPNRAGFISCPFHSADETPSCKIYNDIGRGFYCHACNAGGSVIDFVMRLLDLSYLQAVARLSHDFGLNITQQRPSSKELAALRRKRAQEAAELDAYRAEYDNKVLLHRALWQLTKQPVHTHIDAQNKAWALAQLDYVEQWQYEHPWR